MTIATEINRLQIAKNDIKSAIEAKGVTVGSDLKLDSYPSKIAEITTGGGGSEWSEEYWLGILNEYVRPTDWLILPTLSDTDQKFVGLHAVWEDSNFLSLSATGDYTVDWGDGVIENYNSGVQAYHIYDYNSININTLCSRGYKQVIVVVTPQSGILTNINLSQKHNQSGLPKYSSGWLDIRIAGSLSSLNISSSSPLVSHSKLEIAELRGDNTITTFDYLFSDCYKLQYLTIFNTSKGTSFKNMFKDCNSLQTISLLDTSKGTNFSGMFVNCYSLQTIPLLDTSEGIVFTNVFQNCYSLQTIPLLDTSKVINFSSVFYYCYSLQTIPILNTSKGTDFSYIFRYCYSLQTIPLLNTASGTNFNYMFQECRSLQTIPLLNTASGTLFNSMFQSCYSLQTIPLLDTSKGTSFSGMFNDCRSLQTIPLLDTSKSSIFSAMFNNCYSLQTIPSLNLFSNISSVLTNIFNGCSSLVKGRMNNTRLTISYTGCKLSKTAIVDIFKGLNGGITNISTEIDTVQTIITVNDATLLVEGGYAYIWNATTLNPTGDATHEIVLINSIVGNQLTVTRAQVAKTHTSGRKIGTYTANVQTITITNNWGTSMLNTTDRAIATNRGWTITG